MMSNEINKPQRKEETKIEEKLVEIKGDIEEHFFIERVEMVNKSKTQLCKYLQNDEEC